MFIPGGSAIPTTDYTLTNSLRFRSSASAYLSRTPGSAGNRQIWTWSAWVKRGALGSSDFTLLSAGTTAPTYDSFRFTNDALQFFQAGGSVSSVQTTQLFRDPSAWYHIVLSVDTTQATAANRVRIYVNGTQVTAFSSASYPAQNTSASINNNLVHAIGALWITSPQQYFDGYMDEINFIGGQALTPSSFGSTNPVTGVWQPARYTGTYGTNGFYLNFTNIALTSGSNTGLGQDFSGNGNFWNTNNISVTAGTTYDAMLDVPTLTSATTANYPTLNPLSNTSTLTEANLSATNILLSGSTIATPSSGKWYFEYTQTTSIPSGSLWVGVSSNLDAIPDNQLQGYSYATDGRKVAYNSYTSGYGATWTNGDIIGCALDLDNQTITFFKNGVSQGVAFTGITVQPYVFALSAGGAPSTKGGSINFGQRPFAYTPPTGFNRLNTFNLPNSTIVKGNTVMDATLATGNNSTQVITNAAGFRPDFVWLKIRSASENHIAYDSVRGAQQYLVPNLTLAEATLSSGLTSFNSNGFTLGNANPNYAGSPTFVGWQWQAGQGTNTTNTAGSITSTVSVNATAGFSIATFTAPSTNQSFTVGHGLGVAPRMTIVKRRDNSFGASWWVWHIGLGDNTSSYLVLNSTNAVATEASMWGTVGRTSTLCGFNAPASIIASGTYVLYSWAQIAGFSAFGSYTGANNTGASTPNANGPFIYLGFRPKFVLIKRTSSAAQWVIYDSVRGTSNANLPWLYPNAADAETATEAIDFLSNGFKIRSESGATMFPNGATFIYAAFAENPFKNALAR